MTELESGDPSPGVISPFHAAPTGAPEARIVPPGNAMPDQTILKTLPCRISKS